MRVCLLGNSALLSHIRAYSIGINVEFKFNANQIKVAIGIHLGHYESFESENIRKGSKMRKRKKNTI